MSIMLTDSQRKIVNHVDGPMLVKAGPGSGKTRVLTERIINLINMGKKRILALTFSNKAADEIKSRVIERLGEDANDLVYIGTIHSFCLDIIVSRGNLIGLPPNLSIFELENDRLAILKKAIHESNDAIKLFEQSNIDGSMLKNILRQISDYKKGFVSPDILLASDDEKDILFAKVYESYNNMMLQQRAIDFDDILFYTYELFTSLPQIAKNYTRLYKYIFVDEAQDLNIPQYEVIKALCKDFSNIMLVGDPAQSIYGFNGSVSEIMTEHFVKDFTPDEFDLYENFRSTQKIIQAGKIIQPDIESNSVFPLVGKFEIKRFPNEKDEGEWIAGEIKRLIDNGDACVEDGVNLEDIAIIGRNRYVFNELIDVFNENNLTYNMGPVARKTESESTFIKIFEEGLKILINPVDQVHYEYIKKMIGYTDDKSEGNSLDKLLNFNTTKLHEKYVELYRTLKTVWLILMDNEENFTKVILMLKEYIAKVEYFDDDELFLIENDIIFWEKHWKNYCSTTVKGSRNLAQFRNQIALGMTQEYDDGGISLLTVHMSKGLEYKIVFIVGLNQGTFPDYRAINEKLLLEERNNMFVAVTRAKRICYLTYPIMKKMPWGSSKKQNPSIFVNELISEGF